MTELDEEGNSEDADLDILSDADTASRFAGAAVGVGLAQLLLALDAFPALAALAGAAVSPSVGAAMEEINKRRARRVEEACNTACEEGGYTFDDIVQASIGSDRKIELLSTVLNSAAKSAERRKVRALGRALARGVLQADEALVDAEARVASTLAQLEPPDTKLLEYMAMRASDRFSIQISDKAPSLVESLPILANVIDALIAKLSNLGLVSDATGGSWADTGTGTTWHVTGFGHLCMGTLLAEDAESE